LGVKVPGAGGLFALNTLFVWRAKIEVSILLFDRISHGYFSGLDKPSVHAVGVAVLSDPAVERTVLHDLAANS
jgi:hypothetical protein